MATKFNSFITAEKLIELLIVDNKTLKDTAKFYGCSVDTIKRSMRLYNIRKTSYTLCKFREILKKNSEVVIDLYKTSKNLEFVGKRFGCKGRVISEFLKSTNYPFEKNNYEDISCKLEDIKNLYYDQNKTLKEIGHMLDCCPPKIAKLLTDNGYATKDKNLLLAQRNISDEFRRKCLSSSAKNKNYTLPSGKTISVQGYEPMFLDHIFNKRYVSETDINFKPDRIKYTFNDKIHYYYPDFFIPKHNLIIEIKSTWILAKQGVEKNSQKEKYTRNNGYNFIMIVNNNFSEFDNVVSNL